MINDNFSGAQSKHQPTRSNINVEPTSPVIRIEFPKKIIPRLVSFIQAIGRFSSIIYIRYVPNTTRLYFYSDDEDKYKAFYTLNLQVLDSIKTSGLRMFAIMTDPKRLLEITEDFIDVQPESPLPMEIHLRTRTINYNAENIESCLAYAVSEDSFPIIHNPYDSWLIKISPYYFSCLKEISKRVKADREVNLMFNLQYFRFFSEDIGEGTHDNKQDNFLIELSKDNKVTVNKANYLKLVGTLKKLSVDELQRVQPNNYCIWASVPHEFFGICSPNLEFKNTKKKKKSKPSSALKSLFDEDVHFIIVYDSKIARYKIVLFIYKKEKGEPSEEFLLVEHSIVDLNNASEHFTKDITNILKKDENDTTHHPKININNKFNKNKIMTNTMINSIDVSSFYHIDSKPCEEYIPYSNSKQIKHEENKVDYTEESSRFKFDNLIRINSQSLSIEDFREEEKVDNKNKDDKNKDNKNKGENLNNDILGSISNGSNNDTITQQNNLINIKQNNPTLSLKIKSGDVKDNNNYEVSSNFQNVHLSSIKQNGSNIFSESSVNNLFPQNNIGSVMQVQPQPQKETKMNSKINSKIDPKMNSKMNSKTNVNTINPFSNTINPFGSNNTKAETKQNPFPNPNHSNNPFAPTKETSNFNPFSSNIPKNINNTNNNIPQQKPFLQNLPDSRFNNINNNFLPVKKEVPKLDYKNLIKKE